MKTIKQIDLEKDFDYYFDLVGEKKETIRIIAEEGFVVYLKPLDNENEAR